MITKTPDVCGGSARLRNTRIPVWLIIAFRKQGMSSSAILEYYPSLSKADLENADQYYACHAKEIDEEILDNSLE